MYLFQQFGWSFCIQNFHSDVTYLFFFISLFYYFPLLSPIFIFIPWFYNSLLMLCLFQTLFILVYSNQYVVTNYVQGVNICPTDEEGVYDISCNYVSGGEFSGCEYFLTGGTNLTAIKGNITETNSNMIEVSNIMEYDYIMASSDGMIIKNESFDFSTYSISCPSSTTGL